MEKRNDRLWEGAESPGPDEGVGKADPLSEAPVTTDKNSVLVEIGRVITASPDIDDVYSQFAELVQHLIQFDRIDIVSIDVERGEICTEFVHWIDLDGPFAQIGGMRPLAGSISEQVFAQRSGVLFAPSDHTDVEKDYPRHFATYETGILSSMMVPLVSSGTVVGSLALRSTKRLAYGEDLLRLAEQVGLQISGAVANAALYAEHERAQNQLATLAAIGRVVNSSLDIEQVLGQIVDQTRTILSFDALAINLIESDGATLKTVHMAGGEDGSGWQYGRTYPIAKTVSEDVLRDGRGVVFQPSARAEVAERYSSTLPAFDIGYRSLIVVPLTVEDNAIGTMTLLSKGDGAYSNRDLAVTERVAHEVSGAIANARLYEERLKADRLHSSNKPVRMEIQLRMLGSNRRLTESSSTARLL